MKRWQFSIRSLLFLMAAVSLILAFAVTLPEIFKLLLIVAAAVLFVVGLLQSANFATSNRRPRLAVVSWSLLGLFFALLALLCLRVLVASETADVVMIFLSGTMSACCLVCVVNAFRSFRQIGRGDAQATTAKLPTSDSG